MKREYIIFMNESGNPSGSGVQLSIMAETEFEAIQKAQQRYPRYKVAKIRVK